MKNQQLQNITKYDARPVMSMQYGFSVIHRHGRIMHDRAVKCFALTGQQMGYLKYINENQGVSQEELAKFMRIDKGAVAKAIKDMEEKGYVMRKQNPQDKRAYCLFLTEKAKAVALQGERHAEEFQRKLTEGMTQEEIETFMALLSKITDNMAKMMERGKDYEWKQF